MFSKRLPASLATNRLTEAVARRRADAEPLIDLTLSNPTRAAIDYPADVLEPLSDARGLTYSPSPFGLVDAREAVAREYARHGVAVSPDCVVLTASTSDAYSILFKLLGDAGDEVLVPRPSYPLFDHLTRLDSLVPIPYDLEYHARWSVDVSSVERAVTPRTRALLVVSPNNPTGSFIMRDELDALAHLCARHGLAIVADEVFADYPLETAAAGSAARDVERSDVLTFALGGLSKSIGLPQLKLGWMVVAGPPAQRAAALQRLEHVCDTYLSVATPVQVAAAELLTRGASIRHAIQGRVRANYHALRAMADAVPSCRVLVAEGGWYSVLQVPTFESEDDLVLRLLDAGVLTHPGYFFDFAHESFLVVSLLTPSDAFRDGLSRVLRHFACTTSTNRA